MREINSPRSLEACLRSGLDPLELLPRPKSDFQEKRLTKEMLDIKYNVFENKRRDKITMVAEERHAIIQFSEKKKKAAQDAYGGTGVDIEDGDQFNKNINVLAAEAKRMELLKRRQEDELKQMVEKEKMVVESQKKLERAEEEERKLKKQLEEKKAKAKAAEHEKQIQILQKRQEREEDDAIRKKEIQKKEGENTRRRRKLAEEREKQIKKDALQRELDREAALDKQRQQTEALIQQQIALAEANRNKMMEREARVKAQLDEKKRLKSMEIAEAREKANKRIEAAIQTYETMEMKKKEDYEKRVAEAAVRAAEKEVEEVKKLKKQAEDREKKIHERMERLIESYEIRSDHRRDIVDRRNQRSKAYGIIKKERDYRTSMLKFTTDLQLKDKLENVERVARVNEFIRLQTLRKICEQDRRYDTIQGKKREFHHKHQEEVKHALTRKHEISDAMNQMRVTNDFSMLDKLFSKKNKRGGRKSEDDDDRNVATA